MAGWRQMRAEDLAGVRTLEAGFHIHHPERPAIAPERLRLAPDWCFVLETDDGGFAGYGIAHPWGGTLPPGLDVLLGALPTLTDRLHIHDVVLKEAVRGQGQAGQLVERLVGQARDCGIRQMSLIAVARAGRYWARQGFVDDPDAGRINFVRQSYGGDCTPMIRPTIAAAW